MLSCSEAWNLTAFEVNCILQNVKNMNILLNLIEYYRIGEKRNARLFRQAGFLEPYTMISRSEIGQAMQEWM